MKTLLFAGAGFAFLTGLLPAQSAPKFEVASIRPCEGLSPGVRGGVGSPSPGRLEATCVPVVALIQGASVRYANGHVNSAFPVPVSGGPAWIDSGLYNIEAKAEDDASLEVMAGPMMRALLEDRFNLKIHRETREIPVYALTVAKGGFKQHQLEPGSCPPKMSSEEMVALLQAGKALPKFCGSVRFGPKMADMRGMSLDEFSRNLGRVLGRPIVGNTGIAGIFDFHLEFAPDPATPGLLPGGALHFTAAPSDDDTSNSPGGGPSIFTAMQEQLGLKLDPAKGPGEFLVIDSVSRPSEN
jgi:uncharacterized protein (TIGR03435 family)